MGGQVRYLRLGDRVSWGSISRVKGIQGIRVSGGRVWGEGIQESRDLEDAFKVEDTLAVSTPPTGMFSCVILDLTKFIV